MGGGGGGLHYFEIENSVLAQWFVFNFNLGTTDRRKAWSNIGRGCVD